MLRSKLRLMLDVPAGVEIQGAVQVGDAEVPFKFIRSPNERAPIVFKFHGGILRETRELPAFQSNLRSLIGSAHQMSISDPTMLSREGFNTSWYIGHEDLPTPAILRDFLPAVVEVLSPRSVVFLGSSAGGFAALYQSYYIPGSVALVTVPQTNLEHHFKPLEVQRYLEHCWPGRSIGEVEKIACLDVARLYDAGFSNTVVYLQSQGDFEHSARQMLPFISACWKTGDPFRERLILASDYWGRSGHAGSVPSHAYLPWLHAVLSATSTGVEDILQAYSMLQEKPSAPSPMKPAAGGAPKDRLVHADARLAELVTASLLSYSGTDTGGRDE